MKSYVERICIKVLQNTVMFLLVYEGHSIHTLYITMIVFLPSKAVSYYTSDAADEEDSVDDEETGRL